MKFNYNYIFTKSSNTIESTVVYWEEFSTKKELEDIISREESGSLNINDVFSILFEHREGANICLGCKRKNKYFEVFIMNISDLKRLGWNTNYILEDCKYIEDTLNKVINHPLK